MKRKISPKQHTDVLMLPVDARRAEELGRHLGGPAPDIDAEQSIDEMLELVLGLASIEDAEQRQGVALAAAIGIYSQTPNCQADLSRFMAEYYGTRSE